MAQTAAALTTTPAPAGAAIDAMLATPELAQEIHVGLDRMRRMSHDELRGLIASRVDMLDNVLREREQRREALETARLAAGLLEIRRARSETIRRHVNAWSAVAAFGFLAMVVVQI